MNPYSDVLDFHEKFDCYVGPLPNVPPCDEAILALNLVNEEYQELSEALANEDLPEIADGIADLIYVLCGMALRYGIYLPRIWDAVHLSNMKKEPGKERHNGKILKPEGWKHPDIANLLAVQSTIHHEVAVARLMGH
jgi:predicted HAD superfamily Cof-like phosphohydrolase